MISTSSWSAVTVPERVNSIIAKPRRERTLRTFVSIRCQPEIRRRAPASFEAAMNKSWMTCASVVGTLSLTIGVAAADRTVPTVTNHDDKSYQLQLDCKHVSAGQSVNPDQTVELDSFKVGMDCKINVYPYDNPFGKDGNYDPKKRLSFAKVKKTSECYIRKARVVCE